MADYSNDWRITYGASSCTVHFRCFDVPNAITVHSVPLPHYETEDLLASLRRLCMEYHRLWSFSIAGSDVSRINAAGAGERIAVDERTARLLRAMQAFQAVEPAFDFTVGPVSFLWKHAREIPSQREIEQALQHVGADKVSIDDASVVKSDAAVQVDVGGAAKGFVADDIAKRLRGAGVASADIDLGGNLYMLGNHPEGRPWRVSVRIPEGVKADPVVLEVRDESVVTSGSYERYVEIHGERYQHIIDARTGWPAKADIVSATVVSSSSLEADMLATTALILGHDALPALCARHADCRFIVLP